MRPEGYGPAAPGKRAAGDLAPDLPPDLAEVVAAWPGLDDATRAAVLKLVRGEAD